MVPGASLSVCYWYPRLFSSFPNNRPGLRPNLCDIWPSYGQTLRNHHGELVGEQSMAGPPHSQQFNLFEGVDE